MSGHEKVATDKNQQKIVNSISDEFSDLKISSTHSKASPSRSHSDPSGKPPSRYAEHSEGSSGYPSRVGHSGHLESPNQGILTRIRGFKSDIMKRVSRVLSDEEIKTLARTREETTRQPTEYCSPDEESTEDPNQKQKKGDQSLHDVYKELRHRRVTIAENPPSKDLAKKEDDTDSEVNKVLQVKSNNKLSGKALKEGKSTSEIDCSRNIVERTVTLNRDSDFKANREDQGGQFGVRIVGGKKTAGGIVCAFVASIVPGSPASYSPHIHEGDLVLRWNETILIGLTYEECQEFLDNCDSVDLVVSNFLRGSYRRYKPRSSNTSRTGSVESILRGTSQKWLTITRRGVMTRLSELREEGSGMSESMEMEDQNRISPEESSKIKVELKVLYVAIDNRLSVHLIQAANIPYREGAEGLDVFCKVHLLPETGTDCKRRSKTAGKTYNPYWNQHFEFQHVSLDELSNNKLEITMMTYHWLQKHQPLGQVEVDLSDKRVLSGQAIWYYLKHPSCESPPLSQGNRKLSSDGDTSNIGSRSLSEMVREKVSLQHRITFSTFDSKKDLVPDIRRSASDSTKPAKLPKQKTSAPQQDVEQDDSSDNVFSSTAIQSQLSNIKEVDSGELRRPIDVRGSPRRRAKVIRNRSQAKEDRTQGGEHRQIESDSGFICSAYESSEILPTPSKLKPPIRSNSEDLATTKHRILPVPPQRTRDISLTLPIKKASPITPTSAFSETKVTLTAPSSEEWTANSSTDSITSQKPLRPSPEGRPLIGTGDHSSNLGPGQIAATSQGNMPGSLVLTLGIDKNMLTVEVVQANNLSIRASGIPPDTYVKTYILLDDHRSHKEKTTTVRANANPVFNERITYIVNPHDKILQVMAWDEVGTLRRNVFLGEVMIDLNYILTKGPLQGRYKFFQSCDSKPP